jgi:Glycosyl-transferase for dystroglycan
VRTLLFTGLAGVAWIIICRRHSSVPSQQQAQQPDDQTSMELNVTFLEHFPRQRPARSDSFNAPTRLGTSISQAYCSASAMDLDVVDYTLVTQCSDDRLWMMKHHCERWQKANTYVEDDLDNVNGTKTLWSPIISLAVYTNQTAAAVHHLLVSEMGCLASQLMVQTLSPALQEDDVLKGYPVNILRNMALSAVPTSHVVYVDIDFWPSVDLYDTLQQEVIRNHLALDPRATLVIPAYMILRQCAYERDKVTGEVLIRSDCPEKNIPKMPYTQSQLFNLILQHQAGRFDPTNKGGHGSTKYRDWIDQRPNTLLPIECVSSNRYEPYLVFRFCPSLDTDQSNRTNEAGIIQPLLPPFQPDFTGYGKNKMTWILHLRRLGYVFHQLGRSYLVHYPHVESPARLAWGRSSVVNASVVPKLDPAAMSALAKQFLSKHVPGRVGAMIDGAATLPGVVKEDPDTLSTRLLRRGPTAPSNAAGEAKPVDAFVGVVLPSHRQRTDELYVEFRQWLRSTVPDQLTRTPRCSDALTDDDRLLLPGRANDDEIDNSGAKQEQEM